MARTEPPRRRRWRSFMLIVNRAVSGPTWPLPEGQRRSGCPQAWLLGTRQALPGYKASLQARELAVAMPLCHSTFTLLIKAIKPGTESEGLCSWSRTDNRQEMDSLTIDSSERPTISNLLQLPTPPSAPSQRFTVALKCPEALQD